MAAPARHLDREFFQLLEARPPLRRTVLSWVSRHTFFAPVRVARACPNSFRHHRRLRRGRGEKRGSRVGGAVLTTNGPAARALLVALGTNRADVANGVTNHIFPDAPYLPAHFAHLGGLVLVAKALSTLEDAAPIQAMLQYHAFSRTGYKGPRGVAPPRPRWLPAEWPDNRVLTRAQEDRAIEMLRRYRKSPPRWTAR
jgi:hypothetical protein